MEYILNIFKTYTLLRRDCVEWQKKRVIDDKVVYRMIRITNFQMNRVMNQLAL